MNPQILSIENRITDILSDGNNHSWNSLCERISERPPIITTALIELLQQKVIDCSATQDNIFYFLSKPD